ncbi:MAG: amino acid permease [Polyangiaceae bacterium]|nr:amino acid permease [Polyangiaceae bacterium]
MRLASASAPQRRVLGFWALLTLGLNGIVGVGIFFAPSELARLVPGPASALAFALTALLLSPVAWAYGRLGSAYPEDGGPFVWAREAFGTRFAFAVGIVSYASAVLSTSAVVSGLGQYLAPELGFVTPFERLGFRVLTALLFSGVALLGLRLSAWVWSLLTALKLLPLLLLAVSGVSEGAALASATLPSGEGLARAALVAVFPMQGFEIVAVPGGEVQGGRRTVLLATLSSLALAAALYVLLQLACVAALPTLARVDAPIVEAGSALTSGAGRPWFAMGANVSAIGIAFGMFAMTPRYLAALGTDALLGSGLGRERRGVPVRALVMTTALVLVFVSGASLEGLFVLSSLAVLLQYAVSALSLFRLAGRGDRGLGWLDRVVAPLTLVALAVLSRSAKLAELGVLLGILVLGWLVLAVRRRLASTPAAR